MRVLVVEDEIALGAVFRDALIELGHQPLVARSAEAALGHLVKERPDAILLDLSLPGLSGLDFMQLQPIRESEVPIVAMSGVATESEALECLRLGALDFLGKPVSLDRLGQILATIEPQARYRTPVQSRTSVERRRARRVQVTFPVRIAPYGGDESTGLAVDLSPWGILVRSDMRLVPRTAARLGFGLPDGGPPLAVVALLLRADPLGYAFQFANPSGAEFERLRAIVEQTVAR